MAVDPRAVDPRAVDPRALARSLGARVWLAALCLSLLALLPGCPSPRTQVIVAVDGDSSVLPLIDAFRIDVTGPDGTVRSATSMLADGQPLPRTLGLYWSEGALGPYRVVVSGTSAGSTVTTREARFSFVRERTLVLRITLVRGCLSTVCRPPEVCGETGCRSLDIDPTELEPWTGTITRFDGGGAPLDGGPDGGRPDAHMTPMDAGRDAFVEPPDAFIEPDAYTEPDAFVEPPDAFVEPPDAFVEPPDAFVEPPDAFVAPPDAFVAPPDARPGPPDAHVSLPDAHVSLPDAHVSLPDAR